MNKNNVTPVMTSNNTPAPYKIYASSEAYPAYRMFDEDDSNYWHSQGEAYPWIIIDFGRQQAITGFSIQNNAGGSAIYYPDNFTLSGSNDNINFEDIATYKNQNFNGFGDTKEYTLDKIYSYRYYKITMNQTGYQALSSIRFYCDTLTSNIIKSSILTELIKVKDKYFTLQDKE